METNMNAEIHSELKEKGQALLEAAYEFWKVHQKMCGPRAVVWLTGTDGHFVLFTRGEFLDDIMSRVRPLTNETPLDEPFTVPEVDFAKPHTFILEKEQPGYSCFVSVDSRKETRFTSDAHSIPHQ